MSGLNRSNTLYIQPPVPTFEIQFFQAVIQKGKHQSDYYSFDHQLVLLIIKSGVMKLFSLAPSAV